VSPVSKRVLVIGKNSDTVCDTAAILQAEGWECTRLEKGKEALAQIDDLMPDLVVVQTGVLDMPPSEVCARVRAATPAPVAVVNVDGRDGDREALVCLGRGADVYLESPMDPDLLVAQVRAQLRRATQYCGPSHSRGVLDCGELQIDLDARTVLLRDEQVPMTCKEFDLLSALAIHEGHVMQASDLLKQVWGYAKDCRTRTLEVHICRLRSKLEIDPSDPQIILTVPCVGYRFSRP
jgi:DNA-binding response OmpR family regulator